MGKITERENIAAFLGVLVFLFLKERGSRGDIETYRPVSLTLIVEK